MHRLIFLFLVAGPGGLACSQSSASGRTGSAPVPQTPPAPLSAGTRAEGEAYEIGLQLPANASAGETAVARVVVKARRPYHVNRDYPMSFRSAPTATTSFQGERVALDEGVELMPCSHQPGEACMVAAPLRFTVRDAGEARVAGTVAFSVCSSERCLIEKVPLSATLTAR